jgi:hypothetical protein
MEDEEAVAAEVLEDFREFMYFIVSPQVRRRGPAAHGAFVAAVPCHNN